MSLLSELRVLIVEDDPADAELLMRELRKAQFDPQWCRVDTEEDFLDRLHPELDLILSDFTMPGFCGLRALEILKDKQYDIPFIMVSGSIGEETAVAAIKQGSTDYLLKDRLGRLSSAVSQAVQNHRLRKESLQAEEVLRLTESRYRTLFECAPDGIFITDLDGEFIDCNTSICRMLGYSRNELIQINLCEVSEKVDLLHSDNILKLEDRIERQFKRKDGSLFWTELIVSIMPDGHMLGMVRDITERRRSEERIFEQAALLDQAQDAIVVRRLSGDILFWSKGAERIFGRPSEEILNHNIQEVFGIPPEQFQDINNALLDEGDWAGEFKHVNREHETLSIESRATLIRDETGRVKSVLMINTDITEKKKIESQLMRSQRMESIGTLAGGIAHDLNNILAPIVLCIEILEKMVDDPDAKEILETIETSALRGAEIVRQVLLFARGVPGERTEIRPKQLVKDLTAIVKETFPKNLQIEYTIPENSWAIMGDASQLNQILLNLCVNARDAMPGGGTLKINFENRTVDQIHCRAEVKRRFVAITVTDTGVGIPQELIDKIFEPFFTTKDVGKGTGLGLSTVLTLVKNHEGFIEVDSKLGQGTSFVVCLPAVECSGSTRSPQALTRATTKLGSGEIILVVDDEPSILTITSQTLESFGFRTLTARNGVEAMSLYKRYQGQIHAVITDLAMPLMDGAATIRALKEFDPNSKIIAASGLRTEFPECQSFISKPYTADMLRNALQTTIAK